MVDLQQVLFGAASAARKMSRRNTRQGSTFSLTQIEDEGKNNGATDSALVTALEKLAMDYGFNSNEVKQMADARTVHMLNDYAKLKAKVAGANADAKEVERKSFGLKPSGLRSRKLKRESDLQKITDRAKKTGNRDDQRAAVAAILSNTSR